MVFGKSVETIIVGFIAVVIVANIVVSLIPSLEDALSGFATNLTFGSTSINIEWLPLLMGFGALYLVIRYGVKLFRG